MASDELKPCPFCGCRKIKPCSDDGIAWDKCTGCGATGPTLSRYSGEEGEPYNDWNTRAKDFDAMRQRVELLEGLLSTARDYVYSDLEERKAAMAGYPHKWQQEEADLAEIDAALAQQAKD